MVKRRRKKSTNKSKNNNNTEIFLVLAFLIFILVTASIYLKSQLGIVGRVIGGFFFQMFGVMTYALPPLVLILMLSIIIGYFKGKLAKNIIFLFLIWFCIMLFIGIADNPGGDLASILSQAGQMGVDKQRGPGVLGALFTFLLQRIIGNIGIFLLFLIVVLFFILNLIDMPFRDFLEKIWLSIQRFVQATLAFFQQTKEKRKNRQEIKDKPTGKDPTEEENLLFSSQANKENDSLLVDEDGKTQSIAEIEIRNYADDFSEESSIASQADKKTRPSTRVDKGNDTELDYESIDSKGLAVEKMEKQYVKPPIHLLKQPAKSSKVDEEGLKNQADIIEKTLKSFDIEARVVSIQRGPTVTQFELKPQPGIKVSRITNLADDLALSLAASEIRIEAPIPGKPYVGIEVPNSDKEAVLFREILQTREFQREKESIPVALGQSISGKPIIANIAKMPHLLIAGATGSGKSVCINTIIMSILYKYSPDQVRMILIDPKVVELSVYNGIPHLLIPVVTDPKKASTALYMAVQEMERRYKLFSEYKVRDIKAYRDKLENEDEEEMETLPYLVVIIDELSDLMMVAAKDVETHITRLAQMARACGIHLIIATQRPSVDVITGTIKANIPSRISFQVSSAIDSRTILDMAGAEKLLGKGDMLYYPSNLSKPLRVQGAFITDSEVSSIVDFIKDKHDTQYNKNLMESIEKASNPSTDKDGGPEFQDELMDEVLEFISHEETASISGFQRHFRIGYARAGRIMDDLEAMGAVSAQEGSKPRDVLITTEDLQEEASGNEESVDEDPNEFS